MHGDKKGSFTFIFSLQANILIYSDNKDYFLKVEAVS
jgi:hypothetical protein